MASGTNFKFTFPSAKPIFNLDAGDVFFGDSSKSSNAISHHSKNNAELCKMQNQKPIAQPLVSHVPQSVLLGSLFEHLCSLYESNPEKSKQLFHLICEHLVKLKIISPLSYHEEYASIRSQYKTSFYSLIHSIRLNWELNLPLPFSLDNDDVSNYKRVISHPPFDKCFHSNNVFQFLISRYKEEFEEICELGEGAFGKVFKARNRTDQQEYAIKKINFENVNPENETLQVQKIMREVLSLASLQHPNIVRYHNAWMEDNFEKSNKVFDLFNENNSSPNKPTYSAVDNIAATSKCKNGYTETSLSNSSISWGDSTSVNSNARNGKFWQSQTDDEDDTNFLTSKPIEISKLNKSLLHSSGHKNQVNSPPSDIPVICTDGVQQDSRLKRVQSVINFYPPSKVILKMSQDSISRCRSSGDLLDHNSKNYPCKQTGFPLLCNITLFIQMQICDSSLQLWLKERNKNMFTNILSDFDKKQAIKIFQQILNALAFIHEKDILHRDLKPRNIFLNGPEPKVLLGDFGLARPAVPRYSSAAFTPVEDIAITFDNLDEHTSGIGTTSYAAPEQLLHEHYDFKADMFSAGIILFELTWPLHTAHERGYFLTRLREEDIPPEYSTHWEDISPMLQSLLSHDASKRPSASKLLHHKLFAFDDANKSVLPNKCECEVLKQENARLKEENILLRKQLIDNGFNPLV